MTTTFDPRPGLCHQDGHDTEFASADSVTEITGRLRKIALRLLVNAGDHGLTDDEGGLLLGADRLTFGRRRQELYREGYVVKSDDRRLTPTGRKAIVWKAAVSITDTGLAAA